MKWLFRRPPILKPFRLRPLVLSPVLRLWPPRRKNPPLPSALPPPRRKRPQRWQRPKTSRPQSRSVWVWLPPGPLSSGLPQKCPETLSPPPTVLLYPQGNRNPVWPWFVRAFWKWLDRLVTVPWISPELGMSLSLWVITDAPAWMPLRLPHRARRPRTPT